MGWYFFCPDSIREENPMQDLIQNYVSDLHKAPRGVPQRA